MFRNTMYRSGSAYLPNAKLGSLLQPLSNDYETTIKLFTRHLQNSINKAFSLQSDLVNSLTYNIFLIGVLMVSGLVELRSGSATAPPIEMLREGLRLGQNRGLDSLV
ncbi:hypothetical protein YC2023_008280 [Brassica napus]